MALQVLRWGGAAAVEKRAVLQLGWAVMAWDTGGWHCVFLCSLRRRVGA